MFDGPPLEKLAPSGGSDPRSGGAWGYNGVDGPSRMVKWPTESGGEPSSSNCGASAGVKARQPPFFVYRVSDSDAAEALNFERDQ